MANRRMVSKDISLSEQVNGLSDRDALLFTWAILHADDYGVLRASPGRLKAEVAPLRAYSTTEVSAAISAWIDAGLVVCYECCGEEYMLFPTWEKHQEGLHRRTRKRAMPHPEHDAGCLNFRCSPALSGKFREVPGSSRLTEQNRTERNRTTPEGCRKESSCATEEEPPSSVVDDQTAPLGASPDADVVAYDNPEDLHLVAFNHTDLRNAITTALRNRPQERHADAWLRELLQYAEDYASEGITEQGIIDALTEHPPKARDTGGTTWAKRVFPGPTPARASPKRLERTHAASPPEDFKTGRVKL